MVTVDKSRIPGLMISLKDYFFVQKRIIILCEILLVILIALSLADLGIELIQQDGFSDLGMDSRKGFPSNQANDNNYIGMSNEQSLSMPSMKLKEMFGVSSRSLDNTTTRGDEVIEETQLNLNLKGILVNFLSGIRLALIARPGNVEEIYRVGDEIEGAEIIQIEPRRIVLRRNGINEALNLEIKRLDTSNSKNTNQTSTAYGKNGIRKLSDKERVVSKASLRRQLNNLPRLLQQAKAVPHTVNGQTLGFRVVNIQSGSVFEDLGLQKEDVIRSVNGKSIRSTKDALNAYRDLRTAKSFQVSLLRSGRDITLNLSVQ